MSVPTGPQQPPSDHDQTVALPAELGTFLAELPLAMLLHPTTVGTVVVVKAAATDIAAATGTVLLALRHELYRHPAAPVIRTVLTLFDRPANPLILECFTNVADPEQHATFAGLANQDHIRLLFFDEWLVHRLTKAIAHPERPQVAAMLTQAVRLAHTIPPESYDFDRARAAILAGTQQ